MADREQKLFRWIGNARLATGIVGLGMCFFVFGEVLISVWWLALPLVLFLSLVVMHARVVESLDRANRAVLFYERGLDRLENRWSGKGETGDRFRNPSHIYEEDLDIFGKGSLFELLSTARTRAGEDALAHWLLRPAAREEAAARQEAVTELQPCLDLREELAVLGEAVRSTMDSDAVARWGEAEEVRFPNGARFIALILGAAVAITFGLYMAEVTTRTPFLAALLVELGYAFFLGANSARLGVGEFAGSRSGAARKVARAPRERTVPGSSAAAHAGATQGERTGGIGRDRPPAPVGGAPRLAAQPSIHSHRHGHFVGRASRHGHRALAPALRAAHSRLDRRIGEFEALFALAGYSYEHPGNVLPDLRDVDGGCFDARPASAIR